MADEWQPIETAPKDGTHVILFGRIEWNDYGDEGDSPQVVVGFFYEGQRIFGEEPSWVLVNANPYTDHCHATHWMPVPAEPEAV